MWQFDSSQKKDTRPTDTTTTAKISKLSSAIDVSSGKRNMSYHMEEYRRFDGPQNLFEEFAKCFKMIENEYASFCVL